MMGPRHRSRHRRQPAPMQLLWTQSARTPRCVICRQRFDIPTLSVRYGNGQAHVFCVALDKIRGRAGTNPSKRW